jgi:tight adherence protein B
LQSRWFDREALNSLAAAGHGDYSEARSSSGLRPIYAALGARLANEFVVRYRSLSELGDAVHVRLTAPDVVATSDYFAPAAVKHGEPAETNSTFWTSGILLVVVSIACALLVGLAVLALLAIRPRGRPLQERVEGFAPAAEDVDEPTAGTSRVLAGAERTLAGHRWWAAFEEELEIAQIPVPAVRLLAFTAVGTLLAMWILAAVSGSGLAVLVALAIPFVVRWFVSFRANKQRELFDEQLAENLQVIASAMRAGHSFVGALTVAVDDAPEPAHTELGRAITDEQLGVPLEESLGVVARRMRSSDLEQVILVAVLQRETGGNTAEVVDRVAETIRERNELRRTVKTLTAQGRLARWVVSLLPAALLAIITLLNPDYMTPLFQTSTGHFLLVFGAAMVVFGSLLIKRIVDIKV